MLAFLDDATTQKRVFRLNFLNLFDVDNQNKDLIFIFLKMVLFVILSYCIINYLVNLIFVRNVSQKKLKKEKLKCSFYFENCILMSCSDRVRSRMA